MCLIYAQIRDVIKGAAMLQLEMIEYFREAFADNHVSA